MKEKFEYPVKPGKIGEKLKYMNNCIYWINEYKEGRSTYIRAQESIAFLKDHCNQLYKIINGLEDQDTPEYLAGFDCGVNGATETNCSIKFFSSPEKTKLWEAGKAAGGKQKIDKTKL